MQYLVGDAGALGWVALKALLLFITAVAGFRIAERRTIAELGAFDFVAAVACGAIVGRVPNAPTTSYLAGAVTLVTILLAHAALTRLRMNPSLATLIDHPPRVLVSHGRIDEHQLTRSGLTREDLYGVLRSHNVDSLHDVRFVIFEQRGTVSVVRSGDSDVTASRHGLVPRGHS
ncbi:MAG TPA: YetF domain-containing protein [Candidatus Aquilonibacter sp.]|nr:YetF domain-containing protein [Candidatus Aquilonibacter sp.]